MPASSREAREALGRKARERYSRLAHAQWDSKLRKSSPVDILKLSERGRLPELLPEKHKRMSASPFSYYRGAAPVMAADLSLLPNTGLISQLCGDAHVYNLGSLTGLDGHIIFDINDFDETIPGPWEWDVKRMVASLVLAGREAHNSDARCKEAVLGFVAAYRETMHSLSQLTVLELARYQVLHHPERSPIAPVLRRAEWSTNQQAFSKLAEKSDEGYVFKENRVSSAVAKNVRQAIHDYSISLLPERQHFLQQYQIEDVSFRVVGCGSVGMRDYVALMIATGEDDPLLLQVKEETHSCYAPYLLDARVPENQGQRVAEGQRAMQFQSDIFLGWTAMGGRDYLVRQLRDHKAAITEDSLEGTGLEHYAQVCAQLIAKGHARSGDPCVFLGYMGRGPKLDKAIAKFAFAYADQTDRDYETFKRSLGGKARQASSGKAKSRVTVPSAKSRKKA